MELILGALAAGLVQWLKQFVTNDWARIGILGVISLAIAGVYTWLTYAGYWETVYGVFMTAGAVYVFIIRRFE